MASVPGIRSSSAAERRFKSRYALELKVDFRSLPEGIWGQGHAINLSSGGVLVNTPHTGFQHGIRIGNLLEMGIEWPWTLDGRIPLRLIVTGRVLRHEPTGFAVSIERYEVRTRRPGVMEWPPTGLK